MSECNTILMILYQSSPPDARETFLNMSHLAISEPLSDNRNGSLGYHIALEEGEISLRKAYTARDWFESKAFLLKFRYAGLTATPFY